MEMGRGGGLERGELSAPNQKSQLASDLKSQGQNRKTISTIGVLGSSTHRSKSSNFAI